jgi:eukaryotic-like serine/threonine-protein kinase
LATVGMMGGLVGTIYQTSVARSALAQSERHFAEVRKLANDSLFELHNEIETLPGATAARKKLISNASAYLDRLSSQALSDPTLQVDAAWGWFRLAEIQGGQSAANIGEMEAADKNYKRSISMLNAATEQRPTDVKLLRRLLKVRQSYGSYLSILARTVDADAQYDEVIRVGTSKFDDTAATRGLRLEVAAALIFRATYADAATSFAVQMQDADKARQLMTDLLAVSDLEPMIKNTAEVSLAGALQALGDVANRNPSGPDDDTAIQWAMKSLTLQEARFARAPESLQSQFNAGNANGLVASILISKAKPVEAITYARKALALFKQISANAPNDNVSAISVLRMIGYLAAAQLDSADIAGARSTLSEFDPGWARMNDESKKITEAQTANYVATMLNARLEAAKGIGHCEAARTLAENAKELYRSFMSNEGAILPLIRVKTEADLQRCSTMSAKAKR